MFKQSKSGWLKHWDFILMDLFILQGMFVMAYFFQYKVTMPYKTALYLNMAIIIELIDFLWILMFDIYNNALQRKFIKECVIIIIQAFGIICSTAIWLFITQQGTKYSRSVLYITGLIYIISSIPERQIIKKLVKIKNKKTKKISLVIVTKTSNASKIIQDIENHNNRGYIITGIIMIDDIKQKNTTNNNHNINGIPIVSDIEHATNYLQKTWVDELFIDADIKHFPDKLKEQALLMGIVVHAKIPGTLNTDNNTNFIQRVGSQTVYTSTLNTMSIMEAFIKRSVDIIGGMAGCIVTSILFLFIAPAIYIQSPGPVIFSQIRVGHNGKHFKIYKFRSMYPDAEEHKKELLKNNKINGPMFKMDFDPRVIGNRLNSQGKQITGIGEFIRKTSLDEFPQFFNVLKGDMSLVGTRPPTVEEVNSYDIHHKSRLAIKPGITGLWQVSGRSDILDFNEVVELDNQYIRNWSFLLDLKILFKTINVVINKKGSA